MFYIWFFGILLLWLTVGYVRKVPLKVYIFLPLLLMGLIIGLRYQTGRDLDNYELMFSYAVNRKTEYYYGAEKSYIFLCQLFDLLHLKFQALVLAYSLVSFIFIYKGLCALQLDKNESAGFICTFYALGFSTFFILMRQFLSASIIFYAFSQYGYKHGRREFLKCFILLIIASFIHRGAIVMTPLFFLFQSRLLKSDLIKGFGVLLAVWAGGASFVFYLIRVIVRYLPQYEYYLNKENFGVGRISKVILLLTVSYLLILCLKHKYQNRQKNFEIISRGICFCFIIYYCTLPLGWFHRSYWYVTLFLYFTPSSLLKFFNFRKATAFIYVCLCTLYIIAIYYNIQVSEPLMAPYQFNISLFKAF